MKTKVNEKVFLKDPDSNQSYLMKKVDTETRKAVLTTHTSGDGWNCRKNDFAVRIIK